MTVRWRGQEGGPSLLTRKETAWDCLD